MKYDNLWVVEYSPSQKSVHVDTVGNTIARNGRNIRKGIANDYMTVGLYETSEKAHQQADRFSGNMTEALGLLVDVPPRSGGAVLSSTYGLTPKEVESFYGEQETNFFKEGNDSFIHDKPEINYEGIADKPLMELTEEDFNQIELYKGKTPEFEVIYSCQNQRYSKIYFTPNEHSYWLRGFMLREEQEIWTTQQLLGAVRQWRKA